MKKIAIITTHPIQYNAPWFKLLAKEQNIDLKVFYTWSQSKINVKDKTFGIDIKWDIPLLNGYQYEFVENVSKDPGTHHKNGIINPSLNQIISNWNPNIVLVFGWYLKSHFEVLKHFKNKIPVWFRGDSTLLDQTSNLKKIVRKIWLTYVYKNIDKALYVGLENKKYFLEYGLKNEQLIFAPHAIDNLRFIDSEEKKYEVLAQKYRVELGYSKNDFVILFSGKFEEKKHPEIIIKAIQNINNNGHEIVKLLLVGMGPQETDIKKIIGKDKNIQCIPFQNQSKMPIIYRLGDIFCLPSKGPGETWGLAVNEAMACSRPVIVSDRVGCAVDLVKHGENGYVFKSNDLSGLTAILKSLNHKNCLNLGQQAKKNILEWNYEKIVEAISKHI